MSSDLEHRGPSSGNTALTYKAFYSWVSNFSSMEVWGYKVQRGHHGPASNLVKKNRVIDRRTVLPVSLGKNCKTQSLISKDLQSKFQVFRVR